MTPERCQEIERLYHKAREQGPEQRAALLDQACAGDESLRREVESLLACRPEAENFIEAPAMPKAQPRVASNLVGQAILRYRITAKIGDGVSVPRP